MSRLYRNRGDGTFEDTTDKAGVTFSSFVKGVAWGDYDRDGFPDLYVSNFGEPNVLFHNNGDGTFSVVTSKMGVALPRMSFATWFFDEDNDGWQDLFVAGYLPSIAESVKPYVGQPSTGETMRLYRQFAGPRLRGHHRERRSRPRDLDDGANYGDIDNDGWLDVYLGNGAPSFAALSPNLLFRNHDGRRFVDVTTATGTGHLQKGHGVAIGDIDGDGDEDIFVNMGGFVPADAYAKVLFRNPGHRRHWLSMKLVGVRTNRAAIGARVEVHIPQPRRSTHLPSGLERRVVRRVTADRSRRPRRRGSGVESLDLLAGEPGDAGARASGNRPDSRRHRAGRAEPALENRGSGRTLRPSTAAALCGSAAKAVLSRVDSGYCSVDEPASVKCFVVTNV